MSAPSGRPPCAFGYAPVATRIADYSVMALAIILGGGSLVLFAWPGRPVLAPMGLPLAGALWWNAVLSLFFFAQHSVMVRRPVRARLSAVIPARYDGAFYAITSGIALTFVVVLLQPGGPPLFVLQGVSRLMVRAAALLALAGLIWSGHALKGFDPLGLGPIRQHLRGLPVEPFGFPFRAKPFVVRGPYRWVRHPLYSCIIVLLWADPGPRPGRLVVASLWTAWIYAGALLEERDLIAEFGDRYRRYREQVPILIPWREPAPAQVEPAHEAQ